MEHLVALPPCVEPLRVPRRQCPLKYRMRVSGKRAGSSDAARVLSDWVDGELRCRGPADTFIFTFMDHDGSVQHAAAAAPLPDRDAVQAQMLDRRVPVFLTQHGTGASAQSQADAYKVSGEAQLLGLGLAGATLPPPPRS